MLELLINNFEKIIGGVLSAVFVGYIGYRTYTKTRFNQAAETFRSRVLAELEGLYPIPSNWPSDGMMIDKILRDKFPKLQTAVVEFRNFLSWYRYKAFDKAWFVYRLGEDGREIDKQCYFQYMPYGNNPKFKENFKHNVDNLLRFAKLT